MDEPARVGGIECACDLLEDADRPGGVERPLAQQLFQVGAVDEAHRDVQLPVDLAGVVDRDDVRMLERGGQARLAEEALAERDVVGQVGCEQLQRDVAVEREVVGAVHDPHPAAAEQRPPADSRRAPCRCSVAQP